MTYQEQAEIYADAWFNRDPTFTDDPEVQELVEPCRTHCYPELTDNDEDLPF